MGGGGGIIEVPYEIVGRGEGKLPMSEDNGGGGGGGGGGGSTGKVLVICFVLYNIFVILLTLFTGY